MWGSNGRDNSLSSYLQNNKEQIKNSILSEKEEYLLNVGKENYILHLMEMHSIEYLELLREDAYADTKEEPIPAEHFPMNFNVYAGKRYPKQVFYFRMPFKGDSHLLDYVPSRFSLSFPSINKKGNIISLRVVQFTDNMDEINREYESTVSSIEDRMRNANSDIKQFNDGLESLISSVFEHRKNEILERRKQHAQLIVPLKRNDSISDTFAIPLPNIKKKISVKPIVTEKGFSPDPTLDNETYLDILNIVNDMGKEFERKPSVYANKDEETLRDHFLMLLEPIFEGSATGETFNKSGKTDILLRYNGSNVFVGECKFWKGKKSLLNTIDQLLSYLTWRDSKASIIMFVPNKEFTNVIDTAKETISEHPNFIKFDTQHDETWNNYIFHTDGDKNKEVKLALMMYHTPR